MINTPGADAPPAPQEAPMDPKLARGISRALQDEMAKGGCLPVSDVGACVEAVARWSFSVAKRPDPNPMHQEFDALIAVARKNPNVLLADSVRFAPNSTRMPSLHLASAYRANVTRFAADGTTYEERAWHVRADLCEAWKHGFRWLGWTSWTLISPHLFDRLVERFGRPSDDTLRGTLADAAVLSSWLFLNAMRGVVAVEMSAALAKLCFTPLIIPAPGGVILGGVETTISQKVGKGAYVGYDRGGRYISGIGSPLESECVPAICLQTYLDDALLDADQRNVVAGIRTWFEHEGRSLLMSSPMAAFGLYNDPRNRLATTLPLAWREEVHGRIAQGLLPLYRQAIELFPHWRRRAEKYGVAERDYDALIAANAKPGATAQRTAT